MKKSELRKIIRELIDDELDEMTTTASAGPYNTPYAFTGKKKQNEKKRKSTATQAGYTLSDESGEEEDNTIFEDFKTGQKVMPGHWSGISPKAGAGIIKKHLTPNKVLVKWQNGREEAVDTDKLIPLKEDNTIFEARIDQGSKVKVIRGARKGQTGVVKAVVKGKQITPLTYGQHFRVEFDDGRIQDYQEKSLRLVEGGDPYYAWRNDETATPRQKIGRAISEVNKSLTELNKTLRRCARLKKETGLSAGQDYWKRTNKALLRIEQKAHKMAQRIRQMRV